ncbi:MAG: hypothetical protein F7C09_00695 [Aeropyrum sp.]|nr:hypothetical protein [Aeropyrum sp.]
MEELLPGSYITIGNAKCRVSLPITFGICSDCLLVAGTLRPGSTLYTVDREVIEVVRASLRSFEEQSLEPVRRLESHRLKAAAFAMVYGGLVLYSKCGGEGVISRVYDPRISLEIDFTPSALDWRHVDERVIISLWTSLSEGRIEAIKTLEGRIALPSNAKIKLGGGYSLSVLGFECFPPYVRV